MRSLKQLMNSPSVLMAVVAGFFLCYMLKSYSNKQSMLLSGFQNKRYHAGGEADIPSASTSTATEGFVPSQTEQSVLGGTDLNDATGSTGSSSMHDEVNALLPNGESPQVNLLNPDQIIGMKGQVKRNQTFDLRGNIPIPKQMVPFNNPVAIAEDIYTRGINTLT